MQKSSENDGTNGKCNTTGRKRTERQPLSSTNLAYEHQNKRYHSPDQRATTPVPLRPPGCWQLRSKPKPQPPTVCGPGTPFRAIGRDSAGRWQVTSEYPTTCPDEPGYPFDCPLENGKWKRRLLSFSFFFIWMPQNAHRALALFVSFSFFRL